MDQVEIFVAAVHAQLIEAGLCDRNVVLNPYQPVFGNDFLPQASVFSSHDDAQPHGDPRTGIPRFNHKTQIVVEIIAKANDGAELKQFLSEQINLAMRSLLTDQTWGAGGPGDDDGTQIDGIAGVRRVYDMPTDGHELVGKVQLQLDVLWYSEWMPALPDDMPAFTTMSVGVRQPANTTRPGIAIEVPQ